MLEEIESPFLLSGNPTWKDLIRAVAICRCSHPSVSISLPKLGWPMTFFFLAFRLKKSFESFYEYTKQARANPDFAIHPQKGAEQVDRGGVPLIFRMHLNVLSVLNTGPSAAWDCPIGEASWYHSEALKRMGCDVDYRTDEAKAKWEQFAAENPETARKCAEAREQWLREQKGQ